MAEHTKPLKRSEYLKSISRDHHHGLLLCWKIGEGFKRNVPEMRMKRYTDWFWKTHLEAHFEIEEKYIFPILGTRDKLVKRAMTEHRRLQRLFKQKTEIWRSLRLIEEELDRHIRFEERVLFDEIQRVATAEQLMLISQHHAEDPHLDNWKDEFWKWDGYPLP